MGGRPNVDVRACVYIWAAKKTTEGHKNPTNYWNPLVLSPETRIEDPHVFNVVFGAPNTQYGR